MPNTYFLKHKNVVYQTQFWLLSYKKNSYKIFFIIKIYWKKKNLNQTPYNSFSFFEATIFVAVNPRITAILHVAAVFFRVALAAVFCLPSYNRTRYVYFRLMFSRLNLLFINVFFAKHLFVCLHFTLCCHPRKPQFYMLPPKQNIYYKFI